MVKRSDLAKPGDIYHIKKEHGSFIDFCNVHGFKTTFSKRLPADKRKCDIIKTIKRLAKITGRTPTSREVAEEVRRMFGRSAIKFRFNDLLVEAGCDIVRNNYLKDRQSIINELRKFWGDHGRYPYAEELKATIGIVPNSKIFKESGGYISFLIENNLVGEDTPIKCGRVTIKPTMGLDGKRYGSKCEALFADLLFRSKVSYLTQVKVGKFNGNAQLTVDFLVYDIPLAVEIDGMGPLRDNTANVTEKHNRCKKHGWKWAVLSRDKVKSLCRSKSVSLDILDSLAKT